MRTIFWLLASVLMSSATRAQTPANVTVFKITPVKSTIKFGVKASVPIEDVFDKWDATLTFTSDHAEDGVLDVEIQAGSVNTGSGLKDGKLKDKDFFDVKQDPYNTSHSTKVVQTGPKPEALHLTAIRGISRFPAKEQATATFQAQWHLTGRTTG